MNYEELIKYYSISNLFLNFTKGETFGLTTVEAMSFKLPVIMSNVGVSNEIVTNEITGYIIDDNDLESVVNLIIKVLDNYKLQLELGNNGYAVVNEKFSKEQMAMNSLMVYQKKIKNSK